MKKIYANDWALIVMEKEQITLNHPSTIYTDDDVDVILAETEELLLTEIARLSPEQFTELPEIGEWVDADRVYRYGDKMVRCVQGHNRTIYEPEQTPALFIVIEPTGGDYPVWVQPAGAHDAYKIGDIVWYPTQGSQLYESLINGNVWSPTAHPAGWRLIS